MNKHETIAYCQNIFERLSTANVKPFGSGPLGNSLVKGSAGSLIFLLQLYDVAQSPTVLYYILEEARRTGEEFGQHKTLNYSLGYGKMGNVYLYLQLYRRLDDRRWLDEATKVVWEFAESHGICFALQNGCGINKGTSGVLLVLLELYHYTGENWLYDAIRECIGSIMQKMDVRGAWPTWRDQQHTGECREWISARNAVATTFISIADSFSIEHLSAFVRTNLADLADGRSLAAALYKEMEEAGIKGPPAGMICLKAYELSSDPAYLYSLDNIIAELLEQFGGKMEQDDFTMETGLCGLGYLLLRRLSPAGAVQPDFFLPMKVYSVNVPGARLPFPDEDEFQHIILGGLFRNSYKNCTEEEKERIREKVFKPGSILNVHNFDVLETEEKLRVDLALMKSAAVLKGGSAESEMAEVLAISEVVRKDRETVMSLPITVSSEVIITTLPAADANPDMENFLATYGVGSFACRIDSMGSLDVKPLNLSKIVFDYLGDCGTGNDISAGICQFVASQPAPARALICKYLRAQEPFLEQYINEMVFQAIKFYLTEGVFVLLQREESLFSDKNTLIPKSIQLSNEA
ncbi:hypothetical protein HGH92_29625 [Chitinophaga varians]|uniref:Lanthionine synthetase C-like protein n=1 Tax=Chitinophaga varians TaxID=2202339 RepID=A0A847S9W0_9BACT|nr:lanthionine synthetase LanC family protein [Chitinophaga varians]NLR68501.1 hypothetical protein [Chitinophaga varians]